MNTIGNTIRALRTEKQMTQASLAAALGVQYQSVSKWETGTTLPDTAMLPRIADVFGVSIDTLFGRTHTGCSGRMSEDTTHFLLRTYSQMYGPEAGPWNTSVENKYLEYRFAEFFEKHFPVVPDANICNIGIGAGDWDIYLSYRLKGGSLTSIDRLEICCQQLKQRLICEDNPNTVTVLCADAMSLDLPERFDILTMVGTTGIESGNSIKLLEKAFSFVKSGGLVYYQSTDKTEDPNNVIQTALGCGMLLRTLQEDDGYGFCCRYYKFERK